MIILQPHQRITRYGILMEPLAKLTQDPELLGALMNCKRIDVLTVTRPDRAKTVQLYCYEQSNQIWIDLNIARLD